MSLGRTDGHHQPYTHSLQPTPAYPGRGGEGDARLGGGFFSTRNVTSSHPAMLILSPTGASSSSARLLRQVRPTCEEVQVNFTVRGSPAAPNSRRIHAFWSSLGLRVITMTSEGSIRRRDADSALEEFDWRAKRGSEHAKAKRLAAEASYRRCGRNA